MHTFSICKKFKLHFSLFTSSIHFINKSSHVTYHRIYIYLYRYSKNSKVYFNEFSNVSTRDKGLALYSQFAPGGNIRVGEKKKYRNAKYNTWSTLRIKRRGKTGHGCASYLLARARSTKVNKQIVPIFFFSLFFPWW